MPVVVNEVELLPGPQAAEPPGAPAAPAPATPDADGLRLLLRELDERARRLRAD